MTKIKGDDKDNTIDGGSGPDTIFGFGGDDKLFGNAGDDRLRGGDGADKLDGGRGQDRLHGEAGRDVLFGGEGIDLLTGGGGADKFLFQKDNGKDVVTDFTSGADKIKFEIDDLRFSDLTFDTNKAGDAVIKWGDKGDSITLEGVDPATLSKGDFIFDS